MITEVNEVTEKLHISLFAASSFKVFSKKTPYGNRKTTKELKMPRIKKKMKFFGLNMSDL